MEDKKMINLSQYKQVHPVCAEVEALYAVVSPILQGILYSLKRDIVKQIGGYEGITIALLSRLYKEGDGDCGICFEYAVHDAIANQNPDVLERIDFALEKYCKIKNGKPSSILFGIEKTGAVQLLNSIEEHLTAESILLPGSKGQPVKLKKHIQGVINAFRKPAEREKLPSSINGLWKADLFVGKTEPDKWVGTTVKINPAQLEGAKGLRLAIVPSKQGKSDKIYKHETKNLIVCPVPYDQSFMEIFYQGWAIVKYFLNADAHVPKEVYLPHGADRLVAKFLEDRRNFPVLDVIDALNIVKQPELLDVIEGSVELDEYQKNEIRLTQLIAPESKIKK